MHPRSVGLQHIDRPIPSVGCSSTPSGRRRRPQLQLQATGSLTIRTAESCSPDSDWRTITDRCRCRSIPTNCLPSYSSIGAPRDSWKVDTPSIRRELHEERRPRPFIASIPVLCPERVKGGWRRKPSNMNTCGSACYAA